jgi:hypothetical protein
MHFAPANIEEVVGRYGGYYDISRNLLEGHGFSRVLRPPFTPDPLRTPLYALFTFARVRSTRCCVRGRNLETTKRFIPQSARMTLTGRSPPRDVSLPRGGCAF